MPSFFPGMDPYLESPLWWLEFHHRFIDCWAEAIADELPDEYEASVGERVYLAESDPETRKLVYPDVAVLDSEARAEVPMTSTGAVALQPITIPVQLLDGPREAYIEILHRPERSLIAVLELLSPSNKNEPGRTEYLSKRNTILYQNIHLIELDLLLGGRRLPYKKPLPTADYYYSVARATRRPDCAIYHWNLPQPLEPLPVPLLSPHVDIVVDLAKPFATAYDRGRFGRRIRYKEPCPAPLRPEQRQWVEAIVAARPQS